MCLVPALVDKGGGGFGKRLLRGAAFGLAGSLLNRGGNPLDRRTGLDGRPLPAGTPNYGGMS